MFLCRTIIILCIVMLTTCSLTDNNREEKILEYTDESVNRYESFLVDPAQYTTSGVQYHKRYHKYLIGVARIVTEEKELDIVKSSIGFYFDKKKNVRDELYLGLDINTSLEYSRSYSSYSEAAITQLRKYLNNVLYIIHSCKTVFFENEIVGIVIGINWTRDDVQESVNIWIDQNDVIRYEEKKLTFNELIHRNTITNTQGKIIKLPI